MSLSLADKSVSFKVVDDPSIDVNGLPDEQQFTTARDLAKLARAIIVEFPQYADLFSEMQVQVGNRLIRGHNGMLVRVPGADGMKTCPFRKF
ncbi:MAG TPA: hypothetical protein DCQ79_11170, partial [Rhizobiales bacterium]|nr:hypothetical protein [Hyphomicrobiales bacterium]